MTEAVGGVARGAFPEPEKILNEKSPSLRALLVLHVKAKKACFIHEMFYIISVSHHETFQVIDYNIYTASSFEATAACAVYAVDPQQHPTVSVTTKARKVNYTLSQKAQNWGL